MGTRLQLQTLLEFIIGSRNVYFQPPENIKMDYPCIIYALDNIEVQFADNQPYKRQKKYQVTIIDRDPDSLIPDKMASVPTCKFERHYKADNLNHYVFNLIY